MNKGVQIIIRQQNSILLMKRRNTGYHDGGYGLPGGKVEQEEEVIAAAIREVLEEIDVRIENARILTVFQSDGWEHHIIYAEKWTGTPRNMEPGKCEEIRWFDRSALPSNIIPDVKNLITHLLT